MATRTALILRGDPFIGAALSKLGPLAVRGLGKLVGRPGAAQRVAMITGKTSSILRGAGRIAIPAAAIGVAGVGAERLLGPGGAVLGRRRRGRGITAAELRGVRKVARVCSMFLAACPTAARGRRRRKPC